MKKEINLDPKIVEKLINLPETGMGYQVVDLILGSGETLYDVVVLNGKIAVVNMDIQTYEIVDVVVKDNK